MDIIQKLHKLILSQASTEEVTWDILEALRGTTGMDLTGDSSLTGSLRSEVAYPDTVEDLKTRWPDLQVKYSDPAYRFTGNQEFLDELLENHDSDEAISRGDLESITELRVPAGAAGTYSGDTNALGIIGDSLREVTIEAGNQRLKELDLLENTSLQGVTFEGTDSPFLEVRLPGEGVVLTGLQGSSASVYVPEPQEYIETYGEDNIEDSSDWGETGLMWEDGVRIRFEDGSTVIL